MEQEPVILRFPSGEVVDSDNLSDEGMKKLIDFIQSDDGSEESDMALMEELSQANIDELLLAQLRENQDRLMVFWWTAVVGFGGLAFWSLLDSISGFAAGDWYRAIRGIGEICSYSLLIGGANYLFRLLWSR